MKRYAEIEKEKLDVRVASSLDNGIALQFMGFKRVPFPQEVAARGMWRFTSCEATKRQAYFYEEVRSIECRVLVMDFRWLTLLVFLSHLVA